MKERTHGLLNIVQIFLIDLNKAKCNILLIELENKIMMYLFRALVLCISHCPELGEVPSLGSELNSKLTQHKQFHPIYLPSSKSCPETKAVNTAGENPLTIATPKIVQYIIPTKFHVPLSFLVTGTAELVALRFQ